MLTNTFLHVRGVGPRVERKLWSLGATTWAAFLENGHEFRLSPRLRERVARRIAQSVTALEAGDSGFFAKRLPPNMHWRLYREFREDAAFLDIETTGIGRDPDITMVGILDRDGLRSFVRGENLDELPDALAQYRLLVTFNGKCFDLPVIRRTFRSLHLSRAHIDLRYVLKWLGLTGGLKSIETQMGFARDGFMSEMNGYAAVLLWQRHLAGDGRALNCLVRYNLEDVARLRYFADYAYNRLAAQAPLELDPLDEEAPVTPDVGFDEDLVREIYVRHLAWRKG